MVELGALIAVGRTSDVYSYGDGAVVKVPRADVPHHWADVEADLTAAVHAFGLPAPAVLDTVTVDGRSCVVFERIHATPMWDRMLSHPSDVEALTVELVGLQHTIHSAGLPDDVPDLVGRLRSKLDDCDALDSGDRTEAHSILDRLPVGAAILHGDLHPANVLLGSDGPIAIDWFDASIGHPLADVVRTSLLIRPGFAPEDQRHLPGADQSLLQVMHRAYVAHWSDRLTLAGTDLGQWEAVVAASRISEQAHDDIEPLMSLWNERTSTGPAAMLSI